MPTALNLPLATTVLATLHAKPHLHDHTVWADARPEGTAHSVAGWAVTLAGAEWTQYHEMVCYRGKLRSVPMLARELLGLSHHQACTLFYHCNEQQAVTLLGCWIHQASLIQFRQLIALESEFDCAS